MHILKMAVASFLGTFGFAILLHAPRRAWIPASLVGTVAFVLYDLLLSMGITSPAAIFLGALFGSLIGYLCAWRMQMISTVFMSLSIVSFVPGLGLYRSMELLARSETGGGARQGAEAMVAIAMIVLGLGMGAFLVRLVKPQVSAWKHR